MTEKTVHPPGWEALSEEMKDRLLNEWRDHNVSHDWWDSVIEQFVESALDQGVRIDINPRKSRSGGTYEEPDVHFSGFWSQGDGASFGARVSDWDKFLAAAPRPAWFTPDRAVQATFNSRTQGHNCMAFSFDFDIEENPYDEDNDPLQYSAWQLVHNPPTATDLEEFEETCGELFNGMAAQLYEDLEAEYDHLTSDETVIDSILSYHTIEELQEMEDEEE